MESAKDIIKACRYTDSTRPRPLKGASAVAAALRAMMPDGKFSEYAVYKWYEAGIPERYWELIISLYAGPKKLNAETLHALNKRCRARDSASPDASPLVRV